MKPALPTREDLQLLRLAHDSNAHLLVRRKRREEDGMPASAFAQADGCGPHLLVSVLHNFLVGRMEGTPALKQAAEKAASKYSRPWCQQINHADGLNTPLRTIEVGASVTCLAVWPPPSRPTEPLGSEKPILAIGCEDGTVRVIDLNVGIQHTIDVTRHRWPVYEVGFSQDGSHLVTSSDPDSTVGVWDVKSGAALQHAPAQNETKVAALAISGDGTKVARHGPDRDLDTVEIWEANSGTWKRVSYFSCMKASRILFRDTEDFFCVAAFSPDAKIVATGSVKGVVSLWDVQTGKQSFHGPMRHEGEVTSLIFSHDGKKLITGSDDQTVLIWDTQLGSACEHAIFLHQTKVTGVVFAPDGRTLATRSDAFYEYDDKYLMQWAPPPMRPVAALWDGSNGTFLKHKFVPDGNALAFSQDCTKLYLTPTLLWDMRSDKLVKDPAFGDLHDMSWAMAISPDGLTLATEYRMEPAGLFFCGVQLLDCRKRVVLKRAQSGHRKVVEALAFSPRGQCLATGSRDNTAWLWDTRTLSVRHGPLQHAGWVLAVAFSQDGGILATGGRDRTVRFWNVSTGDLLWVTPLPAVVRALCFPSPDLLLVVCDAHHPNTLVVLRFDIRNIETALTSSTALRMNDTH